MTMLRIDARYIEDRLLSQLVYLERFISMYIILCLFACICVCIYLQVLHMCRCPYLCIWLSGYRYIKSENKFGSRSFILTFCDIFVLCFLGWFFFFGCLPLNLCLRSLCSYDYKYLYYMTGSFMWVMQILIKISNLNRKHVYSVIHLLIIHSFLFNIF